MHRQCHARRAPSRPPGVYRASRSFQFPGNMGRTCPRSGPAAVLFLTDLWYKSRHFPMGRIHRALNHRAVRLAGPILGLACSGLFISRLNLQELGAAFGVLSWWWLVPVLLFGCVNMWLRSVRWGVLLAPAAPLPTVQLLAVGVSAALAGLGLPLRGGDAVKVLLAVRLPGVNLTDVAAAELL